MLDCRPLIQVDLPEAADVANLNDTEVVFAMRVVVLVERFKIPNHSNERPTLDGGHCRDPCGDDHGAAGERAPEGVVESANSGGGIGIISGHGRSSNRLRNQNGTPKGPVVEEQLAYVRTRSTAASGRSGDLDGE
jgi:hypothetical protein